MPNAVLVACNSHDALENGKFRLEYQVTGVVGGQGNFDWAPTFGDDNAELLADLLAAVQAVILARHALEILEDEVIVLGAPVITVPPA